MKLGVLRTTRQTAINARRAARQLPSTIVAAPDDVHGPLARPQPVQLPSAALADSRLVSRTLTTRLQLLLPSAEPLSAAVVVPRAPTADVKMANCAGSAGVMTTAGSSRRQSHAFHSARTRVTGQARPGLQAGQSAAN